jgi:hypothetical protein
MDTRYVVRIEEYCREFNVPPEYLADILRDPKVNPMIRGKGFEFSTLVRLREVLNSEIWAVTKPRMNAQGLDHDVDVLITHLPSKKTVSVECKLSKKGSFKAHPDGRTECSVKCMRSRTIGEEVIVSRAPALGVTEQQLRSHKDNYLTKDFDLVISTLANAIYTTDETSGDYVWAPSEQTKNALERIVGSEESNLQEATFDYLLVAKASNLSPVSNGTICRRRTCENPSTCIFIPNYPSVEFDRDNNQPLEPWNSISSLEALLLQVIGTK